MELARLSLRLQQEEERFVRLDLPHGARLSQGIDYRIELCITPRTMTAEPLQGEGWGTQSRERALWGKASVGREGRRAPRRCTCRCAAPRPGPCLSHAGDSCHAVCVPCYYCIHAGGAQVSDSPGFGHPAVSRKCPTQACRARGIWHEATGGGRHDGGTHAARHRAR